MTASPASPEPDLRPIVLFDGECGLCDRSVRFLLRHERRPVLKFAPLQAEVSDRLLAAAGIAPGRFDSVVLIDSQGIHSDSTAALRLARYLKWPWRLGGLLLFVPRFLRDGVYNLIARRRKRFFGSADVCELAADVSPDDRRRILL